MDRITYAPEIEKYLPTFERIELIKALAAKEELDCNQAVHARPLLNAMRAFIEQRPGLHWGNYETEWELKSDQTIAFRDRMTALAILERLGDTLARGLERGYFSNFELRTAIDATNVDSRLAFTAEGKVVFRASQYFCTEYRGGAAKWMEALLRRLNVLWYR